jgi:type III restriction enzyme
LNFSNGTTVEEKQTSGNLENIWALQLEWLIHRHFTKTLKLTNKGIKCLSLIFIDRVANYMGETPIIKNLFIEKYKAIYPEYNDGKTATDQHIQDIQGYYFAQKASGEYADNEGGVKEQGKDLRTNLKRKRRIAYHFKPCSIYFFSLCSWCWLGQSKCF